jgi:holo-[acyl-carrier protein] synthase
MTTSPAVMDPEAGPSRAAASSGVRVGVDLVVVAEVAEAVEHFGDRYLHRLFTRHELVCCRTGSGYSAQSLAARFAAKEATVKVLRPVGPRPEWRSIEVHRSEGGWCELRLTGRAAALAAAGSIDGWAVSLTHESMMAAAVVVGTVSGGGPDRDRAIVPTESTAVTKSTEPMEV